MVTNARCWGGTIMLVTDTLHIGLRDLQHRFIFLISQFELFGVGKLSATFRSIPLTDFHF